MSSAQVGSPGSTEVARRRLLEVAGATTAGVVAILAPGGYGKSVFAAQLSESARYDQSFWVSLAGVPQGEAALLRTVTSHVRSDDHVDDASDRTFLHPDPSIDELLAGLTLVLDQYCGKAICLVLDDANVADVGEHLLVLLDYLGRLTSPASTLVVTCRGDGGVGASRLLLASAWTVEIEDLRFSHEEIRELLGLLAPDSKPPEDSVAALLNASGGQAAMACVLARHMACGDEVTLPIGRVPLDVASRLEALAEAHLCQSERLALHAGALLGEGRVDDIALITGVDVDINRVAGLIPMIGLDHQGPGATFRLHEYAIRAFTTESFKDDLGSEGVTVRDRASRLLLSRKCDDVALRLAIDHGCERDVLRVLQSRGIPLLRKGNTRLLEAALARLPQVRQVDHPRIAVLEAALERERGRPAAAELRAQVARELAEHEGDMAIVVEASLLLARVQIDSGRYAEARGNLEQALEKPAVGVMGDGERGLVLANLVICCSHSGQAEDAMHYADRCAALDGSASLAPFERAYVLHAATIISALVEGRWSDALPSMHAVASDERVPATLRLMARTNEACVLAFMGRVHGASALTKQVRERSADLGLSAIHDVVGGCEVLCHAAAREYEQAERATEALSHLHQIDVATAAQDKAIRAQWLRAAGEGDSALMSAQDALALSRDAAQAVMMREAAEVEVAACMLFLDDPAPAAVRADSVRSQAAAIEAAYHVLVADLVLAEIARREGRTQEAVARLLEHADYVLTESANLVCAFYIRAFPGLLGVLASAIGSTRLPSHMLRLITGEDAENALTIAWEEMPRSEWHELAERLVGAEDAEALATRLAGGVPCTVRLFGGLEVDTPDGRIPDRAWRKRKARLLFAMLVAKRGQDVPREQLLEHLWPEMTEDKARNNFYVIWNTLKGALSPNLPRGENCPFIESVGGLCRVNPELVRSDLDTFDALLVRARDAEDAGDTGRAIAAYRELESLYLGDLLPGDVYDDWFGTLRDRCRQQFGDAMIQAGRLLDEAGQVDATLLALRKGLDQDPLREDLYQELLRCQIGAGQRSAAIETYLSCRSNLAEELGLDPSSETRLLYDQVLAMEESDSGLVST